MVRWLAVITGFVVGLLISVIGLVLPPFGQIGGGLIGGFVAGYLSGPGLGRGAWHGLLSGALGGLIIAMFVAIGSALLGLTGVVDPVGALFGGAGLATVALLLGFLLALDSAIGGAIGGALKS